VLRAIAIKAVRAQYCFGFSGRTAGLIGCAGMPLRLELAGGDSSSMHERGRESPDATLAHDARVRAPQGAHPLLCLPHARTASGDGCAGSRLETRVAYHGCAGRDPPAELGILVSNTMRCRLGLRVTQDCFTKAMTLQSPGEQFCAERRLNPASHFTRLGCSSVPRCPFRLETPAFDTMRQLPSPVS
jgi:hypothetical protein